MVYTVDVLHDPDYAGPLASAWAQIRRRRSTSDRPVRPRRSRRRVPAGRRAPAPARPHPVRRARRDPGRRPVRAANPSAIGRVRPRRDDGRPGRPGAGPAARCRGRSPRLDDPVTGEIATRIPRLPRLELRFYDAPADLAAAFAAGEVASVADLPPAAAMTLATSTPDARAIRYPSTTLTALAFNLRGLGGPFSDARTPARPAWPRSIGRTSSPTSSAVPAPIGDSHPALVVGVRREGRPGDRLRPRRGVQGAPGGRLATRRQGVDPAARVEAAEGHHPRPGSDGERDRPQRGDPRGRRMDIARPGDDGRGAPARRASWRGSARPTSRWGSSTSTWAWTRIPTPSSRPARPARAARTCRGSRTPPWTRRSWRPERRAPWRSRMKAYAALQTLLGTLQPMPTLFFRDTVFVVGRSSPGPPRGPWPIRAAASGTWYDGATSGGDPLRPVSLTPAEVAELVDALASGASVRKGVWVQIPSSVPSRRREDTQHLPRWRNWYTRTFEGRMRQLIRVQVPAWAPPSRTGTGRLRMEPPFVSPGREPVPRAVSSVGQSASLTPRRPEVRALHRPPPFPQTGSPRRTFRRGLFGAPCSHFAHTVLRGGGMGEEPRRVPRRRPPAAQA